MIDLDPEKNFKHYIFYSLLFGLGAIILSFLHSCS